MPTRKVGPAGATPAPVEATSEQVSASNTSHLAGAGPDLSGPDTSRAGAGEVTASVVVDAPAARVFDAFTAWSRQGEWIPLTTVRVIGGDGGEGSLIEAVTALGGLRLRDQMRVERLDRPFEVRVVHCGPLLRGPGVARCTPLAGGRTQLVWHEWFQLPAGAAGRATWPLLWPGSKLGLHWALRRFARLVEAGALP